MLKLVAIFVSREVRRLDRLEENAAMAPDLAALRSWAEAQVESLRRNEIAQLEERHERDLARLRDDINGIGQRFQTSIQMVENAIETRHKDIVERMELAISLISRNFGP